MNHQPRFLMSKLSKLTWRFHANDNGNDNFVTCRPILALGVGVGILFADETSGKTR